MFSLRTHAIIFGALMALIIVIASLGNALVAEGETLPEPLQLPAQVLFLGLVIALALAAVPVMVKAVIAAQVAAGNAQRPMIKAVMANQTRIIVAMWAIMILGTAIAIPAAVQDGLFEEEPAATETP